MSVLVMHSHVVGGVKAGPDCVCTKAPCGASVYDADTYDVCPWHRRHPAEGHHRADTCTRPKQKPGAVNCSNTAEVVAWIAGNVARVIATAEKPGHDLHTVMGRMTTDRVMDRIRAVYLSEVDHGAHRPEVIMRIGIELIEEYLGQFEL
ncbi:hypothetical protein ACFC7A_26875 [Streptomyces niveus]|uniref:hypothetical protein n=1 Tax=Streptomyces niveus TaxID=193462 RepID=UPI0035D6655C